ncbi:protease SohB [Marinibactrum halimedae]|uniref:Protease SohB n=1 Tax=Marinibactrum halimedae TaxID=1444977 RepID=A0AA37TB03_9GAMM|nr:protease SohB [Marinibactrum halimedae]MCD9459473.1 protease SohB [Marinibactrum halimedae]GLS28127.1 protease SohB [Marinibactrum halimedae]
MEFLMEYGLFLAKTITFVVALAVIVGLIASLSHRGKSSAKGEIKIQNMNEFYDDMFERVEQNLLSEEEYKSQKKQQQKDEKEAEKKRKKLEKEGEAPPPEKRLFVIDFDGDMKASAVEPLKHCVSAVLHAASADDEVLVRLESGGGMVHSYGLASSQLDRITNAGIPLTVSVDKVAASGGYMMACVAKKIIAAPFAIIGSIGVVAQMPNFHRLLKKHDIDFEMLTAGEYKRTLTLFGENTDKGRQKFVEDLEDTHQLFKAFVTEHRPSVDIASVATGEVWYGRQAVDNGLVDELCTSDEYITRQLKETKILRVDFVEHKNIMDRIGGAVESSVDRMATRWLSRLTQHRFF